MSDTSTTPDPVDVDPLALVALADAIDERAALPSPYASPEVAHRAEWFQEDDSDTHDVDPRDTDPTDSTSTPEEA